MDDQREDGIRLSFNDTAAGGSSDKVYYACLARVPDGWMVEIQYGRRGAALMSQVKCSGVDYAKAKKAYDKVVREKINKGYVPEGESAPPQVAPSGAVLDIKPPELLTEIEDAQPYLDDDDHFMQDKSDGVSRGIVKQNGEIVGINKRGLPVPLPAELVALLSQSSLSRFQLDAELVGRKLICRDMLVAETDISNDPYYTRLSKLVSFVLPLASESPLIEVVRTWRGEHKEPAFHQQKAERREGVVFKLKTAPYRAGRNGQHKKFKFIKTLSAIAGTPKRNGKESVELFLYDGEVCQNQKLVRCGTVSLIGKPAINEGDILEVAYLYAYPSGLMVQARILTVRNDVAIEECTTKQLIMKREEGEDADEPRG